MPAESAPARDTPPSWTATTERRDDVLVLRLAGELDYSGRDALEKVLADALATARRGLVADLTEVDFCDSSSLQTLLATSAAARGDGTGFALAGAGRAATRPIDLLGLSAELPVYATVDAAVTAAGRAVAG